MVLPKITFYLLQDGCNSFRIFDQDPESFPQGEREPLVLCCPKHPLSLRVLEPQ